MKRILMIAVLLGVAGASAYGQSERVAVVVNPKNAVTNITIANLREIFQCDRSSWPNGERIAVFSRMVSTPEHDTMLRSIYRMNESDFHQLLVLKQIRGEDSCRITELPSKGMTMEAVRAYRGAIALVRQSEVTPDMKVITVGGKKPEDRDYPLQ